MNRFHPGLSVALVCIAALVPTASNAIEMSPDTLRAFGGLWSIDCGNPSAPRVRIAIDSLSVEQGTQRMTGRQLEEALGMYGQSPPDDYVTSLMSQVRKDAYLNAEIRVDRSGPYLQLGAQDKVAAALGKALQAARFRDCDTARAVRFMADRKAAALEAKRADRALRDATRDYQRVYLRALGPLAKDLWLSHKVYPWAPDKPVRIGGVDYLYGSECKPHDCADNNLVVFHAPAQGIVYGKVQLARRFTFIGSPPPAMQRELDRRWAAEFGQHR